jgi:RNA-directed DNA polymerase
MRVSVVEPGTVNTEVVINLRAGIREAESSWLVPRGLTFNEDKTRVVHLNEGVDFLGFNIRRYRGKLLIKPSKAAVKRIRERLTAEMKALHGCNAQLVLIRLNPIIRGWSAHYRHAVSSKVFNALDTHLWRLTYKWARFTHPHKSKHWVVARYFGAFNSARKDRGCSVIATAAPTCSSSPG